MEGIIVRWWLALLVQYWSWSLGFIECLSADGVPCDSKPVCVVELVAHVHFIFIGIASWAAVECMGDELGQVVVLDLF